MVVVVTISPTSPSSSHIYTLASKPPTPFLLHFRRLYPNSTASNPNGGLSVRAYMENSNSISGFVNKVIGALPIVGLVARIVSDEGGVGSDTIDFAEFRRRVGKKCTINDSRAFYEFQTRRGRVVFLIPIHP